MASKITVPADFGIDNLDNPGQCNVTLKLKGGQDLRVSSVILSYNGAEFKRLFTDLMLTYLEMEDFEEAAVRLFVNAMYSGVIEITRPLFRDVNKMSVRFAVKWISTKCSEFFESLSCAVPSGEFSDFCFVVNEALFADKILKKQHFVVSVVANCGPLSNSKSEEYLRQYMEDYLNLTKDQLDMIVQIGRAGNFPHPPIIARIVVEHLKAADSFLDRNSLHLLKSIGLETYPSAELVEKRQLFREIFDIVYEAKGCSMEDLQFFLQLHQHAFTVYCDGVDISLRSILAIPNLFHSWRQFIDLDNMDDLMVAILGSLEVKNVYMFVECLVIAFLRRPFEFSVYNAVKIVTSMKNLMEQRNWSKISAKFMSSLPLDSKNTSILLDVLKRETAVVNNGDGIGTVNRVVSDEVPNMWDFVTASQRYTFHFEGVADAENNMAENNMAENNMAENNMAENNMAVRPDFVITVIPVDGADCGHFDIRMEFEGHPHAFHVGDVPLPGSVHLVLEERVSNNTHESQQWMNLGLLSWYGKPVFVRHDARNYVEFPSRGFFTPSYGQATSGTVRLVAYYSLPFKNRSLNNHQD